MKRITSSLVLGLLLYLSFLASSTLAASNNPHLCRCTCFVTNTTILPLFSPIDPHNPCTTCTRQFCLSQGLEACRGARIERPDADTGTGWEGEVWAKCLREFHPLCYFSPLCLMKIVSTARTRLREGQNHSLTLCHHCHCSACICNLQRSSADCTRGK